MLGSLGSYTGHNNPCNESKDSSQAAAFRFRILRPLRSLNAVPQMKVRTVSCKASAYHELQSDLRRSSGLGAEGFGSGFGGISMRTRTKHIASAHSHIHKHFLYFTHTHTRMKHTCFHRERERERRSTHAIGTPRSPKPAPPGHRCWSTPCSVPSQDWAATLRLCCSSGCKDISHKFRV